ncbi:MAG: phage tail protein [Oscillospiraceae bacterium]|nr:phage tail protein [Oscillospiraceae bacterium]
MYKVYCDGQLIYHSKLESMQLFNPSLELEVNKTGSFVFTLYPDHPRYGLIAKLKSIITVYQDDFLLFRGRVLEEETGWHNEKMITCEGQLAFLLDSIVRPYEFTGSVREYLSMLLDSHNAQVDAEKRFVLGDITVTDPNDYIVRSNIEYTDTWTEMNAKLLDHMGGYLMPRYEGGTAYLDYLTSVNLLAQQEIVFGANLLDLKIMRKGADIATAVIPLGAKLKDAEGKDTDTRLTIASVNDGLDYIKNDDAVSRYGFIVKTAIFDDITEPETLKIRARGELAQLVKLPDTLELTAADMAATGQDITSFHIGTMVQVTSPPHGINQRLEVSKLSISLTDPGANRMTLGGVVKTFTQQASKPPPVTAKDGRDGQDAVTLRIDSSRGTVFKNSEVATVLQVVIFKGGKTITDAAAMRREFGSAAHLEWQWQRLGESTFGTILATDSKLTDEGFSLLLTPGDVDTKVVFRCQLVTA